MNRDSAMDYQNPNTIRKLGIQALAKELGPVGMAKFIRLYDDGEGDYTAQREQLLAGITLDDILRGIDEKKK